MKLRTVFGMMLLFFMTLAVAPTIQSAAQAEPQTQSELKERFKQRYPQIAKLKDQGKVGETWQGYLEVVRDKSALDSDAAKLMETENADRRKLYELISEDEDVAKGQKRPSPNQVAQRNARRNFEKAKPNEFLQTKEGQWIQRREVSGLKKDGKVGETADGYLEAVKSSYMDDSQTNAVVSEENRIRKDIYRRQAEDNNTSVEEEARRAGKANIKNARSGEYVKEKGSGWVQK